MNTSTTVQTKDVILIAGGTSVKEGIEKGLFDKIKDKEVWSINYSYKVMPFLPKRECWIDTKFFKTNVQDLQKLQEKGVQLFTRTHGTYAFFKGKINTLETTRDPQNKLHLYVGSMGLSGNFALSLAIREGYERIFLLGYDFGNNTLDNFTHYYQKDIKVWSTGVGHPEVYKNKDGSPRREVEDYKNYLEHQDKIFNISLTSNIPYFNKFSYETFFGMI